MRKQQITIKDVAAEVGMSPSSVSRAMSDHPQISDKTKERVRKAAEKLGYRYNALAAALRSSRSKTIGLIVPRISMAYQSAVITAIQNKLHTYGYNLMICQSNESPELEKTQLRLLMAAQMEGVIVSCTLYTDDYSIFDQGTEGIPIVFYDRVPKVGAFHKIVGDEFNGGYRVTQHLIEQGCTRIAHISGPLSSSIYQERYNGYLAALNDHGLQFDEALVAFHELDKENTLKSCEMVFDRELVPDGVFACNDTAALAVLDFAKERNISVPKELKVVGYANDNRTEISEPKITSVEQFPHIMGEEVAGLLMDLIQSKDSTKEFISLVVPNELVERASSSL